MLSKYCPSAAAHVVHLFESYLGRSSFFNANLKATWVFSTAVLEGMIGLQSALRPPKEVRDQENVVDRGINLAGDLLLHKQRRVCRGIVTRTLRTDSDGRAPAYTSACWHSTGINSPRIGVKVLKRIQMEGACRVCVCVCLCVGEGDVGTRNVHNIMIRIIVERELLQN
jgi:hypothetical protein